MIGVAAWTKADAQNVNFAIPTREFSRLMVSKPPLTWDQLGAVAQVPSTSTLIQARQTAMQAVGDEVPAGGYSDFGKRLAESAGTPVTIIVQDERQTNVYRLTIK